MDYTDIASLDEAQFAQAVEGMGRDDLKAVKACLIESKNDIEFQLDANDLTDSDRRRDAGWEISAKSARRHIVNKMSLLDSALSNAPKSGGYAVLVSAREEELDGWHFTPGTLEDFVLGLLENVDGFAHAPDVQFAMPVSVNNVRRIPEWMCGRLTNHNHES